MALELLAGPFDILIDGGAVTGSFTQTPFWMDDYGLIGSLQDADGLDVRYAIVQLDGVAHSRHNYGLNQPTLRYDQQGGVMHYDVIDSEIRRVDPSVGSAEGALLATHVRSGQFARLNDRYIIAEAVAGVGSVSAASLASDGEAVDYIEEFSGFTGVPAGTGYLSPASGGLICVGWSTAGQINIYDATNKVERGKWKSIGMAHKGLWYSPRFGIFISLHNVAAQHDQIRIWADEVRPATVSDPIALSAVEKGKVTTLQTQVLGDQGEPCKDMLVDWSITAGIGELSASQSATDEDGYAEIDYIAPVGSTGNVTVQAEVRF